MFTPVEKTLLRKNRVFLIQNIHLSEVFFAYLVVDHSLTDQMVEVINTMSTRTSQVGKLLDTLVLRPKTAFDTFIRALVYTDQELISKTLAPELTQRLVVERNISRGEACQPEERENEPSMVVTSGKTSFCPTDEQALCSTSASQQTTLQEREHKALPFTKHSVISQVSHDAESGEPVGMDIDPSQEQDIGGTHLKPKVGTYRSIKEMKELDDKNRPVGCVKKGFAIIIFNKSKSMDESLKLNLSQQVEAIDAFFKKLRFTDVECFQSCTFEKLKKNLAKNEDYMESCDAFAMYFLGFGDGDDVFMSDGQRSSVYDDILPLFNGDNLPSLQRKPKLFVFHLVKLGAELPAGDFVDAETSAVSSLGADIVGDAKWADMVIFRSLLMVMPEAIKEEKMDTFMVPFTALVHVINESSQKQGKADEVLKKVKRIVENNELTRNCVVKCKLNLTPLSPNLHPLYLSL